LLQIFNHFMGIIEIEGMKFHACHGHFASEQVVGNWFELNIRIEADCNKAAQSDNLEDALNYQVVYGIIKKEMQTKSFLLENVAGRILDVLYATFPEIEKIRLKVSKLNPPMGGEIEKVSVTLER